MKLIFNKILYWYSAILVVGLLMAGLKGIRKWQDVLLILMFIPILVFLVLQKKGKTKLGLLVYSLFFLVIVMMANVFNLRSIGDLPYVAAFMPTLFYFWLAFKNRPKDKKITAVEEAAVADDSKRKFLKIATSAGVMSLGMFFLNRKKAQAAFFGSVPGPGTVAVKDSSGAKIDPAMNQPLDGYSISNIDTSTTVHYYGFINKDGDWYIIKEDTASNTLLYAKGDSGYAIDNWLTWASAQNYDYFNAKFGN
jgi:hypothetical protein